MLRPICEVAALTKHRMFRKMCTAIRLNVETEEPHPHENAESLIYLHGLFGSSRNWRGVGRKIASSSNLQPLLVDLRNHGSSEHHSNMEVSVMAQDVLNMMEERNLPPSIVLGHSMVLC